MTGNGRCNAVRMDLRRRAPESWREVRTKPGRVPVGVDRRIALAALYLLARIIAARSVASAGLDALSVDDGSRRLGRSRQRGTRGHVPSEVSAEQAQASIVVKADNTMSNCHSKCSAI